MSRTCARGLGIDVYPLVYPCLPVDPIGLCHVDIERGLPRRRRLNCSRGVRLRIADSETVIDPTIVSRRVGRRRRTDPLVELSAREREVLGLVAEGLSNKAIAARLFVTERTIEAYVKQIFRKLRLEVNPESHRRVLAVLAYLSTGLSTDN